MRSYGIDIENEDELIADLKNVMSDCFIKCPTCGEGDNLHHNEDYKNNSDKTEILCNECGDIFLVDKFGAKDEKDYIIDGLKAAGDKWRSERDNLLIENKSAQSEITQLRSRLDECRKKQMMG